MSLSHCISSVVFFFIVLAADGHVTPGLGLPLTL